LHLFRSDFFEIRANVLLSEGTQAQRQSSGGCLFGSGAAEADLLGPCFLDADARALSEGLDIPNDLAI
jgi:hypothetical protein